MLDYLFKRLTFRKVSRWLAVIAWSVVWAQFLFDKVLPETGPWTTAVLGWFVLLATPKFFDPLPKNE